MSGSGEPGPRPIQNNPLKDHRIIGVRWWSLWPNLFLD